MSSKKRTARASLLAGSSLLSAVFSATAFTSIAVVPAAALADNECTPVGVAPSANGSAADNYTCSGSFSATGITYAADGDLTLNAASLNVGTTGVNLTATGSDDVTFTTTAGVTGTAGPVIEVLSAGATATPGTLTVSVDAVTATNANVSYGVNAVSTNGGSINITARAVNAASIFGGSQISAIRAISTGGNGDVTITTTGTITGRVRGIEAQSSGTGALTVTATGAVGAQLTNSASIAAIDARSGTGLMTINLGSGSGNISGGGGGAAILANAGGNVLLSLGTGRTIQGVVDISAVGATTLNNAGNINSPTGGVRITGSGIALTSSGTITGDLDLAGVTGTATFNNTGVFTGAIDLSGLAGNATITHGATSTWNARGENLFGAGANTISTAGTMNVFGVTTFEGVDTFTNSGLIVLGDSTAKVAGDALHLEGAQFIATGASRIVMDVNFSGAQNECLTAAVADCLDVSGGSTSGSTLVTVRDTNSKSAITSSNIVLVEGSSAAGDFTLDPNSDNYTATPDGPILARDLLSWRFVYDAERGNHVLAPVPSDVLFQPATYIAAAQEIWRGTTGSWFDRQADLRSTPGGLKSSGGLWARVGVGSFERDNRMVAHQLGDTVSQTSYSQNASHVIFGADYVGSAGGDSLWVLGVTAGLVRADAEYDGPSAEVSYAGFTGGVYGSLVAGPLFIDANVNTNFVDVVADIPSLGLADDVNLTQTIQSVGARIEAGWRFPLDAYFVEPLAGAEYVKTRGDDIDFETQPAFGSDGYATSLRAGLGLRLGADLGLLGQPATYSLTGRYWEELEGENKALLLGSDPTTIVDDFGGGFAEFDASVNVYSDGGGVSGFFNLGGKFADGYSSVDSAFGVRVRW